VTAKLLKKRKTEPRHNLVVLRLARPFLWHGRLLLL
jgi:ribosomal protein L15E